MIAERLKKSVLQAAMRGKLTEQLTEDGDARDLLAKIKVEKEQMIEEGKIKSEKLLPVATENEVPFEIPENWCWVRLGEVYDVRDGTHDTPAYISKGYPLITGKDFYSGELTLEKTKYISETDYLNIIQRSKVDVGDILFSMIGGNIGSKILITEQNYFPMAIKNVALFKNFSSSLNSFYLYWFLEFETDNMKKIANGGAQSFVSLKVLRNYLMPLPPVAEQKRIIEKIDKVLPLINMLSYDEKNLGILQKSFPKKMKDSILQYAIQGKLTEQLESDGNARDLVKDIQKEKERLIKDGKIKKEKPLPDITEDEIPFDIPENWCWVRIPEVVLFQEGPGILAKDFRAKGVPLIRIAGLQGKFVTLNGCNYLDPEMVNKKWNHFKLLKGDVCISTSASMDKVAIVDDESVGTIPYTGIIRFAPKGKFIINYFLWFVKSQFYSNEINRLSAGGTIKHYGPSHLKQIIIPIPPIFEQKRIVERLDKLLPLCDALE